MRYLIPTKYRTCSKQEHTNVIDSASVGQFEESVGFVHLLHIRLQGSSRHNAPKHVKSWSGKVITGAVRLSGDSVDSRMVADVEAPSFAAGPHHNYDRKEESSETFSIAPGSVLLLPIAGDRLEVRAWGRHSVVR